jgi:amino acid transporter
LQSALACLFAITSSFERLAILANLATLVLYATCCLAAWQLRRRNVQAGGAPLRLPGGGAIPLAACAVIAWMLTSIEAKEWAALGVAIGGATILFLLARWRGAPPATAGETATRGPARG